MGKYNRPFAVLVLASALTLNILLVLHDVAAPSTAPAVVAESTTAADLAQTPSTYSFTVFLPVTEQNYPLRTVFGVELSSVNQSGGLYALVDAKATWVRRNALLWSSVEPSEGARDWSALADLEQEMINASSNGLQLILIVRSTPPWAQQVNNSACGPVLPGKLGAFANFMRDVATRYSAAPYNVHYWEIWNEPDIDPALVPGNNEFGCWGNANDSYYGGGNFAQLLQVIYPQIKSGDSSAQVLIGGLLLDCDPSFAGACSNDKPPRFLEVILRSGGGAYFDGVSYHGYDYYNGALGRYSNANWHSSWTDNNPSWSIFTIGPVGIAKARFIKSLLSAYGVTGKTLINTESALLCAACANDSTFELTKAYYLAQVYASALAEGLDADVWYNFGGWQHSGVSSNGRLLRAYTAFQFASSKLGPASYTHLTLPTIYPVHS